MPPSKILQGRCVKPGASFHGRDSFSSRFFFSISEISANIRKPTKVYAFPYPKDIQIFFFRETIAFLENLEMTQIPGAWDQVICVIMTQCIQKFNLISNRSALSYETNTLYLQILQDLASFHHLIALIA